MVLMDIIQKKEFLILVLINLINQNGGCRKSKTE